MKTRRIWFHIAAVALLLLLGGVMPAPGSATAQEGSKKVASEESAQEPDQDRDEESARDHDKNRDHGDHLRGTWDFVKADAVTLTAVRGGTATAFADDGSKIILTGGGTFRIPSGRVGGGGSWQTFDAAGNVIDSGWYRVKSFISWEPAPGLHPPSPPYFDGVGNFDDTQAGNLHLIIDYLDGTEGVLTVSCHLSENQIPKTPGTVFEGMHATKGYADYFRHQEKSLGDSNTLFHIQSGR